MQNYTFHNLYSETTSKSIISVLEIWNSSQLFPAKGVSAYRRGKTIDKLLGGFGFDKGVCVNMCVFGVRRVIYVYCDYRDFHFP